MKQIKALINSYNNKQKEIKSRLNEFSRIPINHYIYELYFCILTPQSNAKKCWQAVEEIKKLNIINQHSVRKILISNTRFHNNKTQYILRARESWHEINKRLSNNNLNTLELRNWLFNNVPGLGLKESSHFLRNIGKSDNKIAILDRHILKNLKKHKIINNDKIKNNKHYFDIENKYLTFSKKIGISADELDLLFWSQENGEVFK